MTLLLSADALVERRGVAAGALRPLAESLSADLATILARPLYVPGQMALLSRDGGRCTRDGTMLEFDPFSPDAHSCSRCGEVYSGELHHRFWIYWYQLWLAERAVHGAVLGVLGVEPKGIAFATAVLEAYVDQYPRYPNTDNALGPTRPFFSTYLESIWLLQLCVALDLVESSLESSASAVGDRFRDRVVEPSLALIESYDEGMSNRQVWNNAAMMAANSLLDRPAEVERVVWSGSGLAMQLSEALLSDGTWYEGENYHLFAHRGLWYGVTIARRFDSDLPPALLDRFRSGFATPFLTALPDFTLPSRRDSQYAISLRQWRFAEMCELGLAEHDDRPLLAALSRLYRPDIARGDTGRSRSSAEAERNVAPSSLTRADLGWRSLLFARADLPLVDAQPLSSVLLDAQGIGVLRRDRGRVYAALDYGHSGGGHGHPDRLNLLLARDHVRWLDDYGTGSYVDPSLHWYRSTLAHNAPMLDGRSQQRVAGELEAFEDGGGVGWVSASAAIAPNANATRTIVAMPDYLVDEINWTATNSGFIDVPFHVDADPVGLLGPSAPGSLSGGQGAEDGFRFLRDTTRLAAVPKDEAVHFRATRDAETLDLWVSADTPFELWRATAPAAPGQGDAPFILLRAKAPGGTIRGLWSWANAVASADLFPAVVVTTNDARHEHSRVGRGWTVVIVVGDSHSTIDLGGAVVRHPIAIESDVAPEEAPRKAIVLLPSRPVRVTLGEESYRRSEEGWSMAGKPTAHLSFANEGGRLVIDVTVANVDRTFVVEGATNRLDNEHADVNGAGIQLYLRTDDASAGYVLVPRPDTSEVRVRPIDGWGNGIAVHARWRAIDDGYAVTIRTDPFDSVAGTVIDVDVIVNEKPANRERRRGQLVLSGGGGDYIYLRGDRHDSARLIPMLLTDA